MSDSNKGVVEAFYAALTATDFVAAEALCHPDFVFYSQIDTPRPGAKGFIEAERKHLDVFDNLTLTVHRTVNDGEWVAAYVVVEGDQIGDYYGVPPRGGHLRMSMCNLLRIVDGKIIEKRAHYDRLDHIEQLRGS